MKLLLRQDRLKTAGWTSALISIALLTLLSSSLINAQSLDIPTKKWGISFGNSKNFTGLRFNFRDSNIEVINGINVTFWVPPKNEMTGTINGLSIGIMPQASRLRGIQLGLGVGAEKELKGLTIGILGAGSGGDMGGINIGGLGLGAGGDMWGLNIGLLGAGAGGSMKGINIGGLGIGAGENMSGLNFALLGAGAGEKMNGITIAGLGAGAGDELKGLTICGLGAGAPKVRGITIAGLGVGGESIKGIAISLGTVRVENDGEMVGLAVSSFNYIKGTMKGVSIGIVNYAHQLKGIQIGLINIVKSNPKLTRILPIINVHF